MVASGRGASEHDGIYYPQGQRDILRGKRQARRVLMQCPLECGISRGHAWHQTRQVADCSSREESGLELVRQSIAGVVGYSNSFAVLLNVFRSFKDNAVGLGDSSAMMPQ